MPPVFTQQGFGVIRKRISNAHPGHHAIFRGMAWVTLFVFLGKLVGAVKEMQLPIDRASAIK